MLASSRQQRGRSNPPPVWVTTSPLPDGGWSDPYSVTLVATGAALPIVYTIQSGTVTPGLSLATFTGILSGIPQPDPNAPVWTTAAGSLGTVNQGATFSSLLVAPSASLFTVSSGVMPWGLVMNVATGAISGTASVIGGPEDSPGAPPTWTTAAGSLGTVRTTYNGINDPVSISLSATGGTIYTVAAGGLPWGVTMNRDTGALTGFALFVGNDGTWEPDTVVTWSAPTSTNLGTFARGASVGTITQTNTLPGGWVYVSAGVMPWGLTMARSGGAITGTISNENAPGAYNFTVACASNAGFAFGQRTYSITITDPPIVMSAFDDGTNFSDGTGWV